MDLFQRTGRVRHTAWRNRLNEKVTVWGAVGARGSEEANSLAGLTLTNGTSGAANFYRFDNRRVETVHTGEVGMRARTHIGSVGHAFVASTSHFSLKKKTPTRQTI